MITESVNRVSCLSVSYCWLPQVAVSNVPGANDLPTRQQRHIVDKQIKDYSELTRRVENDLRLVHISLVPGYAVNRTHRYMESVFGLFC